MKKILVLHGPNLNLTGSRETSLYGTTTLESINSGLTAQADKAGFLLTSLQSNHEGVLIDAIHQAKIDTIDYIIFNPAAFTHTSIALRDALLAVAIPFIEIHLSNIHARESFRQHSWFSDIAQGVLCGFGPSGYTMALSAAIHNLNSQHSKS